MQKHDLSQPTIFLSPHSDDICYSLGELASKITNGLVINVFSVTGYLPGMHGLDQTDQVRNVTEIRCREDREFADAAAVSMIFAGLMDAPLRKLHPLKAIPTRAELDYIDQPLRDCLKRADQRCGTGGFLLAPAGIGGHVDHATIRDWTIGNLPELCARYAVGFYEDLHYASHARLRKAGLEALGDGLPAGFDISRVRIPIEDFAKKLDLISRYRSQIPESGLDPERFVPAEGPEPSPHEAYWLVMPTRT